MEHERKQIQLKDISVQDTGQVRAVFATLNVIDKQGDIIMNGAVQSGQQVRMSAYNHSSWSGALPVGKGVINETGNELVFEGQFFLDTQGGSETYKTVKNIGDLGEWSFGFDVLEKDFQVDEQTQQEIRRLKKLDVFEVSPVLIGAGVATRTMAIKSVESDDEEHKSKTYQEHAEVVLDTVGDFVKRSLSIAELRTEEGKEPAAEKNRENLKAIASELRKAADELTRLTETKADVRAEVAALFEQLELRTIMGGV